MPPPTVSVIDLTASLGLHALAYLKVSTASGSDFWGQIPLGTGPLAVHLDWYRSNSGEIPRLSLEGSAHVIILVGPGSFTKLRAMLNQLDHSQFVTISAFLMPNALMEEAIFKAIPHSPMHKIQHFKLPDSSAQTFWFILMEQIGKLDFKTLLPFQTLPTPSDDMTTNIKQCMTDVMTIDGALAAALVDYRSGMCLAQAGGGMNLDLAAAGNSQVVKAKLATMESLGLKRGIEDILITLADQYHLIRLVPNNLGLFLYLVLDKNKGNLALARYKLTDIERALKV